MDLGLNLTAAWWALWFIVLFANWVEALAGFGSTLFALILGSYFFALDELIAALVPINLVLSAYLVARHPRWIDWRTLLGRILPWSGLGTVVGIAIAGRVPQAGLRLIFGAVVAGIALFELLRAGRSKPKLGFWQGSAWLLGGGLMQGLYASGGPMVVYFSSRVITDKRVFRSTLSMLWLILNLAVLGGYIASSKIGASSWRLSFWMVPPLVLGIVLGEWSHSRIPERGFKRLVYGLLLIAGCSLVLRSV